MEIILGATNLQYHKEELNKANYGIIDTLLNGGNPTSGCMPVYTYPYCGFIMKNKTVD